VRLQRRHLSWLLLLLTACGDDSPAPPVDTQAPVITAVSPAPWTRVSGDVALTVAATGARRYVYLVDGAALVETEEASIPWNSADPLNGPHAIRFVAMNSAGSVDTTIFLVSDNPGRGTAVLVTPRAVTVDVDSNHQFEATVLGGAAGGVTWRLVSPGDEPDGWGTIDAAGRYTAPGVIPVPPSVTILAQSVADPSKVSTARVTIAGVAVRIFGAPADMYTGDTATLTHQVQGIGDQAITWSVDDAPVHGTIDAQGVFTAPAALPDPPRAVIRATSASRPDRSSVVTIRLANRPPPPPPVTIQLTPDEAEARTNEEILFAATVHNAADTRVDWRVEGGSVNGTISAGGVYRAPASLAVNPTTVIVRAISRQDPTVTATASIRVRRRVTVTVAPATRTLANGQAAQFTATVTNATNPAVTWRVVGPSPGGSVTAEGVYTAPLGMPNPAAVAVWATSVEDPGISGVAYVTITPNEEFATLGRLGTIGYDLAQIGDQAVSLAAELIGQGLGPEGQAGDYTITVEEFSGTTRSVASSDFISYSRFSGRLKCRLRYGSSIDLQIDHTSTSQETSIQFSRRISGTFEREDLVAVDFTDDGESRAGFSPHAISALHHVLGAASTANGAALQVRETIDLFRVEDCFLPTGQNDTRWSCVLWNTGRIDGVTLATQGTIAGRSTPWCGGLQPAVWTADGFVARNLAPYGTFTPVEASASAPAPLVKLALGPAGEIGFRRPGLTQSTRFFP
jgi:hypothetical protein